MTLPEPNGAGPQSAGAEPDGSERHGTAPDGRALPPPVPLVLSCIAGAVGTVLLVAGAVAGSTALSIAGVVAGSLSLGAALYWRSLLISAWAARNQAQPPPPPPR